MSLPVLQMVAACYLPCPGDMLNHMFEVGSSSHHREVSEQGYSWRWRRNLASLLSPTCFFFLPFFTNLHCVSPASTEKGYLEETACAFCSKVWPFLLHSLSSSRNLNKSVSQSCNSLYCFLVFDSKTHENSWRLCRCKCCQHPKSWSTLDKDLWQLEHSPVPRGHHSEHWGCLTLCDMLVPNIPPSCFSQTA